MADSFPVPLSADAAVVMNRWLGNDVERTEQRGLVHQVADTLRSIASELVRVDAESADTATLLPVQDLADRLRHAVTELPRVATTPARAATPVAFLTERSPVSGATNPVAAPLRIEFGTPTVAHVVFTEQYEGPAGGVHGGVVAASFDEVLGIAQMAAGVVGYTGTLEVRYLAVTPLHTLVRIEAGVDRLEGRKLRMRAQLTAGDRVCAEATGVFVVHEQVPQPDGGEGA